LTPVAKPTSIAVGEKDSLLDMKSVEQIKEALEKTGVPTEVKVYKNQVHGFALRSDWSSDEDKKAMDDAEKQGIEWFKKYLS
jgi:dienelactone hydrolase